MAKTQKPTALMLNFRVKEDFAARLDAAAEYLGMSRSDFIRAAVATKIASLGSEIPDDPRPSMTPPRIKPAAAPREGCPHPKDGVVRLATGVKLCQACGAKLR